MWARAKGRSWQQMGLSQWHLDGFELHPEASADFLMTLELFRDERTDYRFNLSSQQPKLFVVLDILQSLEEPNLVAISASQSLAGQYMDGDYLVLSADMPVAIQAWMEPLLAVMASFLKSVVRSVKERGVQVASEFLNRWSRRKLNPETEVEEPAQESVQELAQEAAVEEPTAEPLADESEVAEDIEDEEKYKDLSVAELLTTTAAASVKKAALRKLFLSGEFSAVDILTIMTMTMPQWVSLAPRWLKSFEIG